MKALETMKKITAKEAHTIAERLLIQLGEDGKTFYATDMNEMELYGFDTKKERDAFVERQRKPQIELVITITEEDYEFYKGKKNHSGYRDLFERISNGIPLPKGHGRLIDADALNKKMEEREEKLQDDRSIWESSAVSVALDMFAPTIIESDKWVNFADDLIPIMDEAESEVADEVSN